MFQTSAVYWTLSGTTCKTLNYGECAFTQCVSTFTLLVFVYEHKHQI